jgi:hypothetical protein
MPMATREPDATVTTKKPTAARAPRARQKPNAGAPAGYEKARSEFLDRAQGWLRGRPGRQVNMPTDLAAVASLGVPCSKCGALIYRDRDAGHRINWKREPSHWAAGITATCT